MRILVGGQEEPRMALFEYVVDQNFAALVENAREELGRAIEEENDGDNLWGYFPTFENQELVGKYSLEECRKLHEYMDEAFVPKYVELANTRMSFIRLSLKAQRGQGLHIDADDKAAIVGDSERGSRDVFKFLMNLHESEPREFKYLESSIDEVEKVVGESLSRDKYSTVKFEDIETLPIKSVFLPPREENKVHAIGFLANSTFHAGHDEPNGHFLLSYAGYRDKLFI